MTAHGRQQEQQKLQMAYNNTVFQYYKMQKSSQCVKQGQGGKGEVLFTHYKTYIL